MFICPFIYILIWLTMHLFGSVSIQICRAVRWVAVRDGKGCVVGGTGDILQGRGRDGGKGFIASWHARGKGTWIGSWQGTEKGRKYKYVTEAHRENQGGRQRAQRVGPPGFRGGPQCSIQKAVQNCEFWAFWGCFYDIFDHFCLFFRCFGDSRSFLINYYHY